MPTVCHGCVDESQPHDDVQLHAVSDASPLTDHGYVCSLTPRPGMFASTDESRRPQHADAFWYAYGHADGLRHEVPDAVLRMCDPQYQRGYTHARDWRFRTDGQP